MVYNGPGRETLRKPFVATGAVVSRVDIQQEAVCRQLSLGGTMRLGLLAIAALMMSSSAAAQVRDTTRLPAVAVTDSAAPPTRFDSFEARKKRGRSSGQFVT